MLTIAFPAAAFATNCYVLATGPGEECLVVDPGIGVEDRLAEVCRENGLRPAAVLLTHGHLDHVYAVTPVCGGDTAASLPAYIHGDDRYRLKDPLASMDGGLLTMLEQKTANNLNEEEQKKAGVPPDMVRLSIGLESANDILWDLEQALAKA